MKNKSIYTLLCTAILVPGVSLAMNDDKKKETPHTPISKLREQISAIPKTPSVDEVAQTFDSSVYSPYIAKHHARRQVSDISVQHAKQRDQIERQIETEEFKRELTKTIREEEAARQKLFEERREELKEAEELRQKAEEKRLQELREAEELRQKLAEEKHQVSLELEIKSKKLDEALDSARRREEEDEKQLLLLGTELESLKEESSKAIQRQREKTMQIIEMAEEDVQKRDQTIREKEEESKKIRTTLQSTKLELEKLRLEKQTLLELQDIKSLGSTIERQSVTSKILVPEDLKNVEVKQPSQNITTHVGGSQQEGPTENNLSSDSQNTIIPSNPIDSTSTKKKRTLGTENSTRF